MIKDYSYLCSTRTRQASQRCSNVRVVFVYTHLNMANLIPFAKRFESSENLVNLLTCSLN